MGLRLRVYAPGGRAGARAWRTWCGGCSRTRPTSRSCATASPRAGRSTSCWPRPSVDDAAPGRRTTPRRAATDPRAPGAVRARAGGGVAAGVGPGRVHGRRVGRAEPSLGGRVPAPDRRRAGHAARRRCRRSTPAGPARWWPRPPACTARTPTPAVAAAVAAAASLAAHARRPSGRPCCSGPRSGCARRRHEVAALECFEAGKPWDQADADVCEAIDFCEYYGREALRLEAAGGRAGPVAAGRDQPAHLPGQGRHRRDRAVELPARHPHRHGGGAPWSPATRSSSSRPSRRRCVAWRLVEALVAAGAPRASCQFLPGVGEVVGARLVEHPDGGGDRLHRVEGGGAGHQPSRGRRHRPGQRHVKRVIAEMGGKNAADRRRRRRSRPGGARRRAVGVRLRRAEVLGRVSRLIVVGRPTTRVVRPAGRRHPRAGGRPSAATWRSQVGPVIDEDAHKRVLPLRRGRRPRQGRVLVTARRRARRRLLRRPPIVVAVDDPDVPARPRRDLRPGADGPAGRRPRRGHRAGQRHRLRPHRRRSSPARRPPSAGPPPSCGPATCTSTATSPARSSAASRSAATACRASAPRPAGPTTCCSSLDPRVVTENTLRQGFAPETPARLQPATALSSARRRRQLGVLTHRRRSSRR